MNALLLAAATLIGSYSHPHQIAMLAYTQSGCVKDGGTWDGDADNGLCSFDAEDTVLIKPDYSVQISSVTTNAHTCDFQGAGKLVAPNAVLASAGGCTLRLTQEQNLSVDVAIESGAQECRDFCGMNASLEISASKKK